MEHDFVLNDSGQIAFQAGLLESTGGVITADDDGIWVADPDGLLTLIARTGNLFEVNDDPLMDDFRTISGLESLNRSGGEDGRGISFNAAGQLAFKLSFTDGSEGIFVATIPEAGTLSLLAPGGLVMFKRRRRNT